MSRKKGDAQINLTLPEDLREELGKAAEECGMSRNSLITKLLEDELVRSYGVRMPDAKAELDEFLVDINKLSLHYRNALERAQDAVKIAENGVRNRLKVLDTLTDTVEEQKAEIASMSEQLETLRAEAREAKLDRERAENEAAGFKETLEKVEKENKALRADLDTARSDLMEARETLVVKEEAHAKAFKDLYSEVMRDVMAASRGVPPED